MRKLKTRCAWCGDNTLYMTYHDTEWGTPLHDDTKLFELLTLEGAQAGLSWLTVLKRREGYRAAFNNFNIGDIATFDDDKVISLLQDTGIIRNKLKVVSVIKNAQATLRIQKKFGSFDRYLWRYVNDTPLQHSYTDSSELPVTSDVASRLSNDLRKRGMNFVGPTICYAFMQATGMVNDHVTSCFRYIQLLPT